MKFQHKKSMFLILGACTVFSVASSYAGPIPPCTATLCHESDLLGIYHVSSVTSAPVWKGKVTAGTDACLTGNDENGNPREPNPHCNSDVLVFRNDSQIALVDLTPSGISESASVSSFLQGKLSGANCHSFLLPGHWDGGLMNSEICKATASSQLETAGQKSYVFYSGSTDPRSDADSMGIWTALLTGGALPIGFGSSSKVLLPTGSGVPAQITVEQIDEVMLLFVRGTVHVTFKLENIQ